jgi:hypothetical protein
MAQRWQVVKERGRMSDVDSVTNNFADLIIINI